MKRATFYKCDHCGNIIIKVVDGGPIPTCCGETMHILEPNTTEAATEKHIPVIRERKNGIVTIGVGEVDHPMTEEHYIEWIYVVTVHGVQSICLAPGISPTADFAFNGDIPLKIYAYCNLHGLWCYDLEPEWKAKGFEY